MAPEWVMCEAGHVFESDDFVSFALLRFVRCTRCGDYVTFRTPNGVHLMLKVVVDDTPGGKDDDDRFDLDL